ncbi:hypothetical protein ABMA57_14900 [Saccharospirillum sp. HFRX-1]|uniref:hypothetical protein n=1 Tax=unclassified Saccharospirillum TaxID=2633430 RepID=UPI003713CA98
MLFYGTSDIVTELESRPLNNGAPAERVHLKGGPVLVLSQGALALYKDAASPDDPLGNGLLALVELDEAHQLAPAGERFVTEHRAGYIGLADGQALLVTPAAIVLYANRDDALRNQNARARLNFE